MKRNVLTLLAVALFGTTHAGGQEVQFATIKATDPIEAMEASLTRARGEYQEEVQPEESYEEGGELPREACYEQLEPICEFDRRPRHGITFGIEATYLVPVFSTRGLVDHFEDQASPMNFNFLDDANLLDYDMEAAPRISLGIENDCGRGLRARYWDFNAAAKTVREFSFDQDDDNITYHEANARMDAYLIDFERTWRKQHGCWDLLLSAGARHGSIFQGFTFNRMSFDDDDGGHGAFADFTQRFEGSGITIGLTGRRPLGCTRLSMLWNARGSVLWGDTKARVDAARSNLELDEDDASITADVASDRFSDTLGIGELQAGLDWTRPLECCTGTLFARAMFEGQWWGHDKGSPLLDGVDFYGVTFSIGMTR